MERVLNLAGKNSSEIFQLRYPFSLLSFCDYDLSYFAENAVAVCDEALRSGELDADRVTDLRNSLRNMHVYIEHNLRTVYDKIVLDCWIDYICRRDNIGTAALWNRFIDCKTAFEKAVFVRLCEYRYNKGINEWLNLVRVQDYAKNKVYFLFSKELTGVEEASARRNYFDLMFSVTARELGCRLEDLGVTQVFSAGRAPSAPFMYPSISKDIMKNALADFDYSDDYSDIGSYEIMADQIAMDAFSHMKSALAQELGSYNMSRPAMENAPGKIYMPCGLKAAVDLEIDALLESGGWLARCKRCGRYYVRDSEYTEEYCSLPGPGGRTCLEIYEAEHPRSRVTPEMERQCSQIMDEMYGRVTDGSMSLKEYESWRIYLEAMKTKVNNGEIQPDDLTAFIAYSRTMDISRSNPVVEVKKPVAEVHERVVKPFVPERISRSDIGRQPEPVPEPEPVQEPVQRREGFFTSPSVERQKSQARPVSHIIRGEQAFAETRPYQMPLKQEAPRQERVLPDFGENESAPREAENTFRQRGNSGFRAFGENAEPAVTPRPQRQETEPLRNDAPAARQPEPSGFKPFAESAKSEQKPAEKPAVQSPESGFRAFAENTAAEPEVTEERFEEPSEPSPEWEKPAEPEKAPEPKPAPRVIRKNAAAISAYGRMAGTVTKSDAAFEAVSRPEPTPEVPAEEPKIEQPEDPFWEIGSIFDVLEQSENDTRQEPVENPEQKKPQPEKPAEKPRRAPSKKRRTAPESENQPQQEVPSGIWTEDRHLYEEPAAASHEELNMLKDKKRRSSKTQRLFDAIMKEPDDNPNFRKR